MLCLLCVGEPLPLPVQLLHVFRPVLLPPGLPRLHTGGPTARGGANQGLPRRPTCISSFLLTRSSRPATQPVHGAHHGEVLDGEGGLEGGVGGVLEGDAGLEVGQLGLVELLVCGGGVSGRAGHPAELFCTGRSLQTD